MSDFTSMCEFKKLYAYTDVFNTKSLADFLLLSCLHCFMDNFVMVTIAGYPCVNEA